MLTSESYHLGGICKRISDFRYDIALNYYNEGYNVDVDVLHIVDLNDVEQAISLTSKLDTELIRVLRGDDYNDIVEHISATSKLFRSAVELYHRHAYTRLYDGDMICTRDGVVFPRDPRADRQLCPFCASDVGVVRIDHL